MSNQTVEVVPGAKIAGTYEVIGPLGHGGMGQVFAAKNLRTERLVALKLLKPEAKKHADVLARFRREAKATGLITSDHVLQVLSVEDDPDHGIVLVFEHLSGESLLDRLRREGPIALPQLHPIVVQILRGLVDAHAASVIHRDIKPSNVFLERRPDGSTRVKLLDFGISKLPGAKVSTPLTAPGSGIGSYSYMPPEQFQGAATVDARADLYSLGVLVFQSLTGELPFVVPDLAELLRAKFAEASRSLAAAARHPFPAEVEAWVARCLRADPAGRFPSAAEALAAWQPLVSAVAPAAPSSSARPDDQPTVRDQATLPLPLARSSRAPIPAEMTAPELPMERNPLWLGVAAIVVVIAIAAFLILRR